MSSSEESWTESCESWADLTEAEELEDLQRRIAEHLVRVRDQISHMEFQAWKTYLETTAAAPYLRELLKAREG